MELTFNSNKQKERIQQVFESVMKDIQNNMSNGIRETEIYIPKEISGDVKDMINEVTKDKDFIWMTVRRGHNQYTGRPESYIGMTIGDNKYYKLKYCGN